MSGKRGTAPRLSQDGAIKASGIEQVYVTLRDSLRIEQEALLADGPLPHPDDIHAVLVRAAASLHALGRRQSKLRAVERALTQFVLGKERHRHLKRPELRYVRLALRRHVEHGLTLEQAFGYTRGARGAAPHPAEHELQLARRAFEARFVIGRRVDPKAYSAVNNTQARKALENHAVYVLESFEAERLEVLRQSQPELAECYAKRQPGRPRAQLWSVEQQRRLMPYYRRRMQRHIAPRE